MIRLWRWPEMTQILETRGDPKSVTDVEFSPDGRWLGSCGELTSPAVRDARTLNPVHKLIGGGGIRAINFSSNSRRVVTSGHDGTARIWDMNRGRELLTLRCGTAFVHRALFSPDGRTLATGDASGSIRFWSGPAESGAAIKIPTTQSATAPSTMPRNED
jgi:WD40 repeat protein